MKCLPKIPAGTILQAVQAHVALAGTMTVLVLVRKVLAGMMTVLANLVLVGQALVTAVPVLAGILDQALVTVLRRHHHGSTRIFTGARCVGCDSNGGIHWIQNWKEFQG